MDSKLKALKVADLRALLVAADAAAPAKAPKADLISRILASGPAQDAYRSIYEPDFLDEPEAEEAPAAADPEEEEPVPLAKADVVPVDPELAKRQQRAARFGIPLVEKPPAKAKKAAPEDLVKLNTRAARFGRGTLKRPAPAEQVDAEEAERRRKRAERFGLRE